MTEEHPTASTQPLDEIDVPSGPPIVGRSTEIALIRKRLDSVTDGKGRILAFSGPSGIGKTRLLQQAKSIAMSQGFDVAYVVCRGSEHSDGLALRTLLSTLLGLTPSHTLQKATQHFGIGDIHDRLSTVLLSDTAQGNPVAVANLILQVLTARADKKQPVLLCIDDLDEADDETAATLLKVASNLEDKSVLSLVTYVEQPPSWKNTLGETLTLDPLTASELKQIAPPMTHADYLTSLAEQTEGNPLLVRLALGVASKGDTVAASPQEAVKQQFRTMSPAEGSILAALVVLGDGASLGYALRSGMVRGTNPDEATKKLIKNDWLTRLEPTDRLVFSNTIIRNSLASTMPTDVRKKYHQRAGDYYHETSISGQRLHTKEAVHHYEKAGNTTQALAALDLAVQDAQRRGDRSAIITIYEQALDIMRSDDGVSSSKRSEYAEKLGDIHARDEEYQKASTAYAKADLENSSLTLRGKLGLCLLMSDGVRASHILKPVVGRVPLTYPDDFRWHLETALAWAYTLSDNHYEAIRSCRDALGLLGQMTGYGEAKTLVRTILGTVMMYQGEHKDAQGHLEAAQLSWEARGDKAGVELITLAQRSAPRPSITKALLELCLKPHLR